MHVARVPKQSYSIIGLLGVFVAIVFMGADIIYLSLRPLKYLGIWFPPVLEYTHFIAPLFACGVWIVFHRRWPWLSVLAAYLFGCSTIGGAAYWADHQVDKVKITTFITSNDIDSLQSRLGFKVWEQGDYSGTTLSIARVPAHTFQLTAETKRMGIYRQ
jgi:hypothetical protein